MSFNSLGNTECSVIYLRADEGTGELSELSQNSWKGCTYVFGNVTASGVDIVPARNKWGLGLEEPVTL